MCIRDRGNTVLVVEHDEDAIRTADHIIDMGPGAGVHGGEIVAQGKLEDILANENILTCDYLSGRREVAVPAKRRKGVSKKLTVHNATANNLRGVTASIPLGTFTCITGVSGSGKSSFTVDTLYAASARAVSYTHLDVYKRQTPSMPRGSAATSNRSRPMPASSSR